MNDQHRLAPDQRWFENHHRPLAPNRAPLIKPGSASLTCRLNDDVNQHQPTQQGSFLFRGFGALAQNKPIHCEQQGNTNQGKEQHLWHLTQDPFYRLTGIFNRRQISLR